MCVCVCVDMGILFDMAEHPKSFNKNKEGYKEFKNLLKQHVSINTNCYSILHLTFKPCNSVFQTLFCSIACFSRVFTCLP